MARRALLIGAATYGLLGVDNDVATMERLLGRRGFTTRLCTGTEATRAGILDAYGKLIADSGKGDAVLVYYSGHGGLVRQPDGDLPPGHAAERAQFIVPTDLGGPEATEFRGITGTELSVLQTRLTEVTANVTAVFDCCHAGQLSREGDLRLKSLPEIRYSTVTDHIRLLREHGLDVSVRHLHGNPYAVRVIACDRDQSAFEHREDTNRFAGVLTTALAHALDEAGDLPVTWADLICRTRQLARGLHAYQRPDVEGPARRLLFEETAVDPLGALPVVADGRDRVTLPGAAFLGFQVGDEFVVLPPGAHVADRATALGTGTVQSVTMTAAHGAVRWHGPATAVPAGARAVLTRTAAPALPVRILDPDDRTAVLASAISARPLLRVAAEGEVADVTLRLAPDGAAVVADGIGDLHPPRHVAAGGVHQVVDNLEQLARAAIVRGLADDSRFTLDARAVEIEWGLVVDGRPQPLPRSDETLQAGQRVYVRVHNPGPRTLHVSLVDIGLSARMSVVTAFAPAGVTIEPGGEFMLGRDETGALVGVEVQWPARLRPAAARRETIVVLATTRPHDIRLLEQDGVRGPAVPRTPLDHVLAQVSTGGRRDLPAWSGSAPAGYFAANIDFDLLPGLGATPGAEPPFLLDERRPRPEQRWARRGGAPVPKTIAVRLEELVIHRNRALLGADIRIDAVVLTGAGNPTARTARFSRVRDGERLPLDRFLIYHGPAVDYLDIAIWVSRDRARSLALSELLRAELTGPAVQGAGLQLAGLVAAAPQAAAVVGAVGATAVLVDAGYRLLSAAVGNCVGLYRTSLLADELFGVGRHPATDRLTVQGFSFAYTVEAVG